MYRQKHAFVVMCDKSDESSLDAVHNCLKEITEHANIKDYVIMVLANKSDLNVDSQVIQNFEKTLPRDGSIVFNEISLLPNLQLHNVILNLATMLHERRDSYIEQRMKDIKEHNSHNRFSIGDRGSR